jgi:50S ribosomal protein L16 3-hydroxylase
LADQALDDADVDDADDALYRDAGQRAVTAPAAIPEALQRFAYRALQRATRSRTEWNRVLGEVLTEPKPQVWFQANNKLVLQARAGWCVAAGTRMLYDQNHLYINGESFRAAGRDAQLLRRLADSGQLSAGEHHTLSAPARALIQDWLRQGWIVETPLAE